MKFEVGLTRCLGAFATASSVGEYHRARALGARLPRKQQLLVVDAAIAARRRLESEGVL